MVGGWKIQVVMAVVAALLVGGTWAYRQPGSVYEIIDWRSVPHVETIDFSSKALNQPYRLFVQLPPGYARSGKRYPVLYALDGQAATTLYTNAILPLIRRREIPELIVVGIGHTSDRRGAMLRISSPDAPRMRDFTPVPDPAIPQSGHADSFLAILNDEIIPLIDDKYRTNSEDRAIGGYELGGLFSFYAVLSRPELFQRCLAIDPLFAWADEQIFEVEAKMAAKKGPLEAQVYFASLGEQALSVPMAAMMADTLRGRGFPNLDVEDVVTTSSDQSNALESAVANGLRFIYQRPF